MLASFSENRSWDRMFKDIMLPDEKDAKNAGAAEFLKTRVKDLNRLTIDASSTFFGVNVSCAQCHDHPHVQQWTQDQFYGMKSFFARTVDSGGYLGERDFGVVKYTPNKGAEKVSPVLFLTGKTIDAPGMKDPTGEEKRNASRCGSTSARRRRPRRRRRPSACAASWSRSPWRRRTAISSPATSSIAWCIASWAAAW